MNTVDPIRSKKDIAALKRSLSGRNRLLLIVGLNSALRISDILSLRVSDVLEPNGTPRAAISLVERKTGKTKAFTLNDSIKRELRSQVKSTGLIYSDAPLFPSRKGTAAISRVQAYRILNDAAKRAGLADHIAIGTHTLRKTMAYHAYKSGVDLALLMQILNHSSQRETLRYIGITRDNMDEVYTALNL